MNVIRAASLSVSVSLLLAACQADPSNAPAAPEAAMASEASQTWPASLVVVGDGFPNAGDACRVIGESSATISFLDDSATLAGCLDASAAAELGGTTVGVVDGVTLVSVPRAAAAPGDGDGQGDAVVAGTNYHATAQIPCSGYQGAAPGLCNAGVVRGTETGTYIDVTLPDGSTRTIFFGTDNAFLTFSTAESNGTAALEISSRREGDTTIATLGTERYEIPDVFVIGD